MKGPYSRLLAVLAVNAVVMFVLGYSMIAEVGHFHVNVNAVYMSLMMVAPMAIAMILGMRSMYTDARRNVVFVALFAALFVATFALARYQAPVGDRQFLRSMIPHHSSAILMCEEAALSDPRIEALCAEIVRSQREEIAQMEALLAER